ncbi:MAG: DNA primase [Planctomycetota bacterium]
MGDRADIERVLSATDIVRVVRERVDLKEKGREWVGLCPFHDDRSPSMYVSPAKQIFKCFACGEGGDVLAFVQKYDGVDFPQALRHLAEVAGIELSNRPREASESTRTERAAVLEANAFAQRYFRETLADPARGRTARAMIERRGISPEMQEAFGLGAAVDAWDGLANAVARARAPMEAFVQAELLHPRKTGQGHYDVFRDRLMFPIADQGGRVIAFGGRTLGDDPETAKYYNSPATSVFAKSKVLYGLRQATPAIRREGFCIVTEGYTDTIACHQAGFANTVATLGTAFTADHARLLRRLCSRVLLLFDGDAAGLNAADKAVGVLFAEPLDVQIAVLGGDAGAKDPDELLRRQDGAERFRGLLGAARDVLAFRFDRLRGRLEGRGRAATLEAIEEDVRWLAEHGIADLEPARQDHLFAQLASVSGLDQHRLRTLAAGTRRRAPAERTDAPAAERPPLRPADRLLGLLLGEPTLWAGLAEDDIVLLRDAVQGGASEPVARVLDELISEGEEPTLPILRTLLDEASLQWAASLIAEAEHASAGDTHEKSVSRTERIRGLLRQIGREVGTQQADPLDRVRAAREHIARFQADPARIARP